MLTNTAIGCDELIECVFVYVGDVFRGLIDRFLRSSLQKSVPSIFVSIAVHYSSLEKVREGSRGKR